MDIRKRDRVGRYGAKLHGAGKAGSRQGDHDPISSLLTPRLPALDLRAPPTLLQVCQRVSFAESLNVRCCSPGPMDPGKRAISSKSWKR